MPSIILALFAGIITHQSNRTLARWQRTGTGSAWINMTRMTIGVVAVLPVYLLIRGNSGDELKRDAMAYLSAFTSFGVGVGVGYILDEH